MVGVCEALTVLVSCSGAPLPVALLSSAMVLVVSVSSLPVWLVTLVTTVVLGAVMLVFSTGAVSADELVLFTGLYWYWAWLGPFCVTEALPVLIAFCTAWHWLAIELFPTLPVAALPPYWGCPMAGAATSSASPSIAANNINFLNFLPP